MPQWARTAAATAERWRCRGGGGMVRRARYWSGRRVRPRPRPCRSWRGPRSPRRGEASVGGDPADVAARPCSAMRREPDAQGPALQWAGETPPVRPTPELRAAEMILSTRPGLAPIRRSVRFEAFLAPGLGRGMQTRRSSQPGMRPGRRCNRSVQARRRGRRDFGVPREQVVAVRTAAALPRTPWPPGSPA